MNIKALIASKHPDPTCWLELEYAEREGLPAGLHDRLLEAGWMPQEFKPPAAGGGVCWATYTSPGSTMFRSWTASEFLIKMHGLTKVLRQFHIPFERRSLRLEDML